MDQAVRPRQPTDGQAMPVLVTPHIAQVAGPHGIVPLEIEGEAVAGRVVGVVNHFPSITKQIDKVIIVVIAVSLMPGAISWLASRNKKPATPPVAT